MGLTSAEWKEVANAAQELLGDDWSPTGNGRHLRLLRRPVGWWIQEVRYETSSAGRFLAWGGLLAKPIATGMEIGDSGMNSERVRQKLGSRRYRELMGDVRDPRSLQRFTDFVDSIKFARDRDFEAAALAYRESYLRIKDQGKLDRIFSGPTRQNYLMFRLMSGAVPREELVDDAKWVLSGDDYQIPIRDKLGLNPDWGHTFYPELASYIEAAHWPGVADLLLRTRQQNLAEFGIPKELLADVVVPEPEFPW